ncbi:hypothetical protein K438DRAFT_1767055 [Mycena galopus ATCC 62051]|nr:hypothetical protein K438DRAFT_1767055 [Mycena galopus ATCC 62051]
MPHPGSVHVYEAKRLRRPKISLKDSEPRGTQRGLWMAYRKKSVNISLSGRPMCLVLLLGRHHIPHSPALIIAARVGGGGGQQTNLPVAVMEAHREGHVAVDTSAPGHSDLITVTVIKATARCGEKGESCAAHMPCCSNSACFYPRIGFGVIVVLLLRRGDQRDQKAGRTD